VQYPASLSAPGSISSSAESFSSTRHRAAPGLGLASDILSSADFWSCCARSTSSSSLLPLPRFVLCLISVSCSAARSHTSRSAPPHFLVPAPKSHVPAHLFLFLLEGPLRVAPDLIFVPILPAQRASVLSFEASGTPCSSGQFNFLCSIAAAGV
jgi:hypothetical protein